MRFWLWMYFLLSTQIGIGANIDSLYVVMNRYTPSDTAYVLAMGELAIELRNTKRDSSVWYATQAWSLAERMGFEKGKARAKRAMGVCSYLRGEHSHAMVHFEQALQAAEVAEDLYTVASCYNNMGLIYKDKADYEAASTNYFNALKIFEQIGDKHGVAWSFNSIGGIYAEQGDHAKALEYYFSALELYKEVRHQHGIANAYSSIGSTYRRQGKYNKALEYCRLALEISEDIHNKGAEVYFAGNMADLYVLSGEASLALPYLERGMRGAKELQGKERIAQFEGLYAKYYNALNRPDSALLRAKASALLAKELSNFILWRDAEEQAYMAAEHLNRYKEAFESLRLFKQLADSVNSDENTKRLLAQEWSYKEERQKLRHAQELAEERMLNLALIVSVVLLLSILGFAIYAYQIKQRAHRIVMLQKAQIQEQRDMLAAYNTEIQQQNEEIRQHQEEVVSINNNLERLVKERTVKLEHQNKILADYAFMNAHKLRAPLARILGLVYLIPMEQNETVKVRLIEMVGEGAKELDEVVHEIQRILGESHELRKMQSESDEDV